MSGLFKKRLADGDDARIERPASKSWIFFTFLLAFVLNIALGEQFWAPDFVALSIVFWTLRELFSTSLTSFTSFLHLGCSLASLAPQ